MSWRFLITVALLLGVCPAASTLAASTPDQGVRHRRLKQLRQRACMLQREIDFIDDALKRLGRRSARALRRATSQPLQLALRKIYVARERRLLARRAFLGAQLARTLRAIKTMNQSHNQSKGKNDAACAITASAI